VDRVRLGRCRVGIALVPSSVRRLCREDVEYLIPDEPEISSPIIMSHRTDDRSPLLTHILKLIDEFDQCTESDVSSPRRKGGLRQAREGAMCGRLLFWWLRDDPSLVIHSVFWAGR